MNARFCPACAQPVVGLPDLSERKLATLIFADLVGSTQLGSSQDPERTRVVLERFYDAMTEEITNAGGTVEKFAGDSVMAAFGVPSALEDHAERALHAALAMRARLDDVTGGALALRIGVTTGEVVSGSPRKGSSFATGDPVNVAARLEQAAEPGEILVGVRTVSLVGAAFEFDEPQTVTAKGKTGGVTCQRLVRALARTRPRGALGVRAAFVGRTDELAVLQEAFSETVSTGRAQLVTVVGDAGVGKSRLIAELWEKLSESSPQIQRRVGRCLSYGQGLTYSPLAEVLKDQFDINEDDPPEVVLATLSSREILGATLGYDVAGDLHPMVAKARFQDAWVDLLETTAQHGALLLVIEDIHWADDLLLELLERIVADALAPVLVVTTARPDLLEQRPGWGARVNGRALALEAFATDDTLALLKNLFGGALPTGDVAAIVRDSEGNPLFVEELVASLHDQGLLTRRDDAWVLRALPPDFHVPDTIRGVIAARLDLLEPAEKRALQAAAVIGRTFWAGAVYDLVTDLGPDLRVLEERGFIRRHFDSVIDGDREYAFKHALIRDVAYAGIPLATRAHMHATLGGWIADSRPRSEELAPLLAHHYAEAVRPDCVDLAWADDDTELARLRELALTWLHLAATQAAARLDIEEAVQLFHRAIDLEPDPVGRAEMWREVGNAKASVYDGEGFWLAMQEALKATDDPVVQTDIYADLAFHTVIRAGMWVRRPDPELVESWVRRAFDLSQPGTPARAKALIAQAQLDEAAPLAPTHAQEASDIAAELDDMELQSAAWSTLSMCAMARADFEMGVDWAQRRLAFIPRLTDPDHLFDIYIGLAIALTSMGRFEHARQNIDLAGALALPLSPHHRLHAVCFHVSVDWLTGDWTAVSRQTAHLERAVHDNELSSCVLGPIALLQCAVANMRLGDAQEAERLEQCAADEGMQGWGVYFNTFYLALALARSNRADVERLLETVSMRSLLVIEDATTRLDGLVFVGAWDDIRAEAPRVLVPGSYIEPFAMRALGRANDDPQLIRQAAVRFDAMGLTWHADQTRRWVDAR